MSWIAGLAGKAEDFLNKVDQTAATALHKDDKMHQRSVAMAGSTNYSPYLVQDSKPASVRPNTLSPNVTPVNSGANLSNSTSVPSNLHKMDNSHNSRSTKRSPAATTPSGSSSARHSPVRTSKKDKDEELFEFLNSKDTADGSSKKKMSSNGVGILNGMHSRQSSASSASTPNGSKTPDHGTPTISVTVSDKTPEDKSVNGLSDSGTEQTTGSVTEDVLSSHAGEPSSGYISNQDDMPESESLSSLELENRLLKNEVTQLNQEMASIIQRAKEAQDELARVKGKLDETNQIKIHTDQIIRELQSQEADLHEALRAKDSQLAVLRVRLEEADKELTEKRSKVEELRNERDRILKDHTSSAGVQGQALETLKEKLQTAELQLHREKEAVRRIQEEAMQHQSALASEKEQLSQELMSLQKKANEDRVKCSELSMQLKSAKSQVDAVKLELQEYKEKATRILQSKDRLIASLKDGTGLAEGETGISLAELEQMRQERDMFKEEVQRAQMTIENLRTEISELEMQLQQESDNARDAISSLEEQLQAEKDRREDAENEIQKQKQELRYAHEELVKQKTAFLSRIEQRENEIECLRNQLTNKSMSTSSEAELENRLHALTESLIQKQTMLEALSTEKNSLVLQLERMERQYQEAETSAQRATATTISMNTDDDDLRNRLPVFMRESPLDSNVARRVKRAAKSIDRFSMRLGLFLRRYPVARIFVICYMVLLHLWVSLVLLTYKPEIHDDGYMPKPPGT